ncbi:tRNA (adenosine(37)-N6)-threonylcarbamoyltransferase complex ATPase subunit type 1 TsaE [Paracoccaceae bacterium]|nr:tRNA (adenosine(37)-N6)-threonylcarbamoyltransferase complex ATPase subunit type 1 TsaE [Paracoccaceae bacterium]
MKISELNRLSIIFTNHLKKKDIVLLSGKVGVGKTELSRSIIKAKAKKNRTNIGEIPSPSFSIIQTYKFEDCAISHIDLYRVGNAEELVELNIPEMFASQISIIEWPEILQSCHLKRYIGITIKENKSFFDGRDFEIKFVGGNWDYLYNDLLESKYFANIFGK